MTEEGEKERGGKKEDGRRRSFLQKDFLDSCPETWDGQLICQIHVAMASEGRGLEKERKEIGRAVEMSMPRAVFPPAGFRGKEGRKEGAGARE